MATFQELKNRFDALTGLNDEIDNAVLAIWFNEAQLDLAFELGEIATEEYAAGAEQALPPALLRIVDCSAEYTLTPDGKLTLPGGGVLYYRRAPAMFTGTEMDAVSELPEAVHHLIPLWAASRYWDMESEGDGEESSHASKWMAYYQQGKTYCLQLLDQARAALSEWRIVP